MSTTCGQVNINDKSIELTSLTGHVAGLRKYSKTYVSGGGTGGNSSINSEVVTKTEYFLQHDDGTESPHWHTDESIILRDGNRVTLVYASTKEPLLTALINHDSKSWSYIRECGTLLKELKVFMSPWGIAILLFIAAIAVIAAIHNNTLPSSDNDQVKYVWGAAPGVVAGLCQSLRISGAATRLRTAIQECVQRLM